MNVLTFFIKKQNNLKTNKTKEAVFKDNAFI